MDKIGLETAPKGIVAGLTSHTYTSKDTAFQFLHIIAFFAFDVKKFAEPMGKRINEANISPYLIIRENANYINHFSKTLMQDPNKII